MKFERWRTADLPEDLVQAMQRQSLYSTVAFADLWRAHRGSPACWVAQDGSRTVAALLGVEFHRRPFTRFQSMPDGLYSGLWQESADSAKGGDSLVPLLQAIAAHGYAKIFLTDLDSKLPVGTAYSRSEYETVCLDISRPGWEPADAALRSEIRKAEREGVRAAAFDPNRHMDQFLALSRRTEERHERAPRYPDRFYADLAALAQVDQRIQWIVVEHEGELAASQIHLIDGSKALYWQSVFDKKYSFLKPNQYMLSQMAGQLAARGVTKFLLGGSPEDALGLKAFKEKWGGSVLSYPIYTHKSWAGRLL